MRIGIVLHPFGTSRRGLEQYTYETTCAILRKSPENLKIIVFVKSNADVSDLPKNIEIVRLSGRWWVLALWKWRNEVDRFIFFTEHAPYFLWKKSIIVFFDAASIRFGSSSIVARSKRYFYAWWSGYMMRTACRVVTISEASKRDLISCFAVPEEKIEVIYPGFKVFSQVVDTGEHIKKEKYFMYVGPFKERKNVHRIIEAYCMFRDTTAHTHELYLVGRKSTGPYAENIRTYISKSAWAHAIHFKESVNDDALRDMYVHGTALVYPSLLEGFGLPVLEALSCSCMVITSKTTSTKEAAGDAAILVDPYDVAEIARAMEQVAAGRYDATRFIQNAKKQCALFSWDRSGEAWCRILLKQDTNSASQ